MKEIHKVLWIPTLMLYCYPFSSFVCQTFVLAKYYIRISIIIYKYMKPTCISASHNLESESKLEFPVDTTTINYTTVDLMCLSKKRF